MREAATTKALGLIARLALKNHKNNGYLPVAIVHHGTGWILYSGNFSREIIEEGTRQDAILDAIYRNFYQLHRHRAAVLDALDTKQLGQGLAIFGVKAYPDSFHEKHEMFKLVTDNISAFHGNVLGYVLILNDPGITTNKTPST